MSPRFDTYPTPLSPPLHTHTLHPLRRVCTTYFVLMAEKLGNHEPRRFVDRKRIGSMLKNAVLNITFNDILFFFG